MPFIAFLGCDGCGKSTVIEKLELHFKASGMEVSRGHWAPRRGDGGGRGSAEDPHGKPPRGSLMSLAKLGYLGFRWWAGWWGGLRAGSRRGVLLFDRYHADLLVDPRRYRYGGPQWVARWAVAWMPQPDLAFFLDAAPEVLLGRKQEVGHAALLESRERYLALASKQPRIRVIDASRSVEQVMADVFRELEGLKRGR